MATAALAGTVAILLTAGLVTLRAPSDRSGEPTLVASGVLGPRDRILVADFADRAGDSVLAQAITEAIRVDLSQSPLVQTLTPREVRVGLARMERSPDLALDDSLARELAVREGLKAFLTGSVARWGEGYTVSAQLVSAHSGEAVASLRETAQNPSRLIPAIDRLSKSIRARIGESWGDLRKLPTLEQKTTGSLPALRKYTQGYRLNLAGERTRALPLLQQAVALDTGFAAGWSAMGRIYESLAEPGRAAAAYRHALANQGRLPFLERRFLVATDAYNRGDYENAVSEYTQLLRRYPDNVAALNNLALAYRDWRRFTTAESLFRRAIQVDSTIATIYFGLHSTQVFQGRFTDSRHTLDLIGRRFPDDPILRVVEVQDAAARQAWEEAERRARVTIAAKQSDSLYLVDAYEALAGIVMTRGRLLEAERHWRTQLVMSAAAGSWGRRLFGAQQLGYLYLRYRNAPARARELVDSALARRPLDSILPGDRPYYELARFYAFTGDLPRAQALIAAGAGNDSILGRDRPAERSWARGVVALAANRAREAEVELRKATEVHLCAICPLPDLARAFEALGKPDSALAAYQRYLGTPWLWRYETDASELGRAMQRLGELYEGREQPREAAEAYDRLLSLWRRADADLRSVTVHLSARLEGLKERRGGNRN